MVSIVQAWERVERRDKLKNDGNMLLISFKMADHMNEEKEEGIINFQQGQPPSKNKIDGTNKQIEKIRK